MKHLILLLAATSLVAAAPPATLHFRDDFKHKLGPGWVWVREHPGAWRATARGLEVRLEPGNMWGPQNDARNVLVRPAPDPAQGEVEVGATVENQPTSQYEQVDLVWFFDDSNMVKLGQELVDGKLSVVMGREETDKCRTIAIIPLDSASVRLRLFVKGGEIRGQFAVPGTGKWKEVGRCSVPAPKGATAKVSLQFYQGAEKVEHWARVTDFAILKHP